ncbi:MAG TPA: DNA polymerase III subunit gamma/tau [Microbacteriaceae bacterium]|nr:DNA polymerase III subunit gamma/tau [Microbacteriaceae bacterium]HRA08876.1 DNA polymerase III subunit gamma/tau [Microbacteriaceae bacterium]
MTAGRDEDALSWGDDDPTLDAGSSHPGFDDQQLDAVALTPTPDVLAQPEAQPEPAAPTLPQGWTAVGAGAETVDVVAEPGAEADTEAAAAPMGNAALVSLGVFGGVFVLYAIGWYLGATRLAAVQVSSGYGGLLGIPMLADDFMYLVWVVLATIAAPIWFIATLFVTRGERFWKRFVGLLCGVVLLVPWPFLMIGAGAA